MWIFAFDEEGEAEELLGQEHLLPHEARDPLSATEAGSLLESLDFDVEEDDGAPKGDDEPADPEESEDDESDNDQEEVDEEEDDLEEDDEEEFDDEDE